MSSNWAGYAALTDLKEPETGSVTSVKGTWIVPTLDCSSGSQTYSSMWVGIDGYASKSVEQVGTAGECSYGRPKYSAWYEMFPEYPVTVDLRISPGDLMYGEVKYIGNDQFAMVIADLTTGQVSKTVQKSTGLMRNSAEWIAEAPVSQSGVLPLADFGTGKFLSGYATIGNVTGSIMDPSWEADIIQMKDRSGLQKATTSPASENGAFDVTYLHE